MKFNKNTQKPVQDICEFLIFSFDQKCLYLEDADEIYFYLDQKLMQSVTCILNAHLNYIESYFCYFV